FSRETVTLSFYSLGHAEVASVTVPLENIHSWSSQHYAEAEHSLLKGGNGIREVKEFVHKQLGSSTAISRPGTQLDYLLVSSRSFNFQGGNILWVSQAQQDYLENHIQTQSSALDSFNAMNSALASDSIGLQKTLVDVTLENSSVKDQIRNLRQTYEASMDKLREKQRQLEVAQAENQLLKMKVESSQEANAEVMREMTRKLYSQYEEKLHEEQQRHSAEKEALLEETNSFLKAIEEANKKMQAAEISLEEKDQRIGELDRLIERMEKERHQLQLQLLEHETEMSGEITDSDKERYQQLEEASASLRERIRHLDDMVHCQQKKVKQMVEEIESLKKKVQQKQHLILQLLEKISFLEGENNELQSRLDYLTETQPRTEVETREIGVGCDLLPSQTGRTREITMPSRNYTPYTRVLELTMKKTLT
uniref:Myocardial zonula adherens protein n=1 Tax=Catagonus wagneri TaxID=51154 RepID=A0A8C3VPZ2_9CETA